MEMDEIELTKRLNAINLREAELGVKQLELDVKSSEQEIVRRNIEACVNVMKIGNSADYNELESIGATKIKELIVKLEA